MFALNLADGGRILSATYPEYAPEDAALVEELPDGNLADYLYQDGTYVYAPVPAPEVPAVKSMGERIAELEEQLRAAKILLGVEE